MRRGLPVPLIVQMTATPDDQNGQQAPSSDFAAGGAWVALFLSIWRCSLSRYESRCERFSPERSPGVEEKRGDLPGKIGQNQAGQTAA